MLQPTIIAIGELLVEFVSRRRGCGLRTLTEYLGPYPSGAPAIAIDQAARMGARTQIFGSLGADSFGDVVIDRLHSHGVQTAAVRRLSDKTTGVAFVSYFDDGTRTFIFHLNDTAADAVAQVRFQLPDDPLLLHVSGSSLGNPALRSAIEIAVAEVLRRGGQISCDPNARAELMGDAQVRASLDAIMNKCTYLFPSTSDLDFLYPGKSEEEVVRVMQSHGAKIVVLKRGSQGATVFTEDERFAFSGLAVQEVDPTGAGDCFCGTFLALMAQGRSAEFAGRQANAAGALAVTRHGPMEGNSDACELQRFVASLDDASPTGAQHHG